MISDFRPPSVTDSDEAAVRRLFASRAIGGYSLTSDDPTPGVANRVPIIASGSTTGCLKAPFLVSLLSSSARSLSGRVHAAYASSCF